MTGSWRWRHTPTAAHCSHSTSAPRTRTVVSALRSKRSSAALGSAVAACAHRGHDRLVLGAVWTCASPREHIGDRRALCITFRALPRYEDREEPPQHHPTPDSAAATANPSTVTSPETSPPLR